jgi:hypothetical protein
LLPTFWAPVKKLAPGASRAPTYDFVEGPAPVTRKCAFPARRRWRRSNGAELDPDDQLSGNSGRALYCLAAGRRHSEHDAGVSRIFSRGLDPTTHTRSRETGRPVLRDSLRSPRNFPDRLAFGEILDRNPAMVFTVSINGAGGRRNFRDLMPISQWRLRRWPVARSSPVDAGSAGLEWSERHAPCALRPRKPRRAERLLRVRVPAAARAASSIRPAARSIDGGSGDRISS